MAKFKATVLLDELFGTMSRTEQNEFLESMLHTRHTDERKVIFRRVMLQHEIDEMKSI